MAVGLSETEAGSIVSQLELGKAVVVACINSPNNVTLAGDSANLDCLEKHLQSRGVCSQWLRVDVAYHSRHMEAIETKYYEAISDVVPREGIQGRAMFSAVTGKEIGAKELGSEYWVKNIFSEAVTSLLTSFSTREKIFMEIGPHHTMQTPLKQIFASYSETSGPSIEYVSLLSRGKDSAAAAYAAAGQLFSLGMGVNVARLNETTTGRRPQLIVDLPPYSWRHEADPNSPSAI
ncbi:polyketide synthase [Apiospora phragmitis]|uniref:Polyketide synthase n=1 Tax=Apiospora phragmitis TaxID=2905665 RepID=A0ABR1UUG9_9PEZI